MRTVFIISITLFIGASVYAGYYFSDALVTVGMMSLLFIKKLFTPGFAIAVIKKLPLLLLLGGKKLLIQIISGLFFYAAMTKLRFVRRLVALTRLYTRKVHRLLRCEWEQMSGFEKILALVVLLPYSLFLLVFFMVFFTVPNFVRVFLGKKLQETVGLSAIKVLSPRFITQKLKTTDGKIKQAVRDKLKKTEQ